MMKDRLIILCNSKKSVSNDSVIPAKEGIQALNLEIGIHFQKGQSNPDSFLLLILFSKHDSISLIAFRDV
jgi:hypothetical protein